LHADLAHSEREHLKHGPYIESLPGPDQLLTPLHFTSQELDAFKGTNLYGATLDRERDWKKEWEQCSTVIEQPLWKNAFTW
jgi:hypothetical protein